jgi:invasion protein IalB
LAFFLVRPVSVVAQDKNQPASFKEDSQRFGAWELLCAPPSSPSHACRLTQKLVAADRGEPVFLTTVLPASKKGSHVGILSAPSGGYLPPGMELRIDGGKAFKVLFETCNAMGCHGGFELGGRVLKELSGGKFLSVRLWTTKSTPVDVKINLEGFSRGFSALKERA